jgi:formylglycine-generating enzyme required for sulfatase activity
MRSSLVDPGALAATALVALLAAPATAQEPGTRFLDTVPDTEITFETVFLPGGVFALGSPDDEAGRDDDEGPVRRVQVPGFWMGIHEVTHEAFAPFRNPPRDLPPGVDAVTHPSTPYDDPALGMGGEGHPAVGMTRLAALHYARWLSLRTGRLYRLPTEAEWEYACRAGLPDDPEPLETRAWFADNAGSRLQPVGTRAPDLNGIHDLLGNAAEWTLDPYVVRFYREIPGDAPSLDPRSGPAGAGRGVVRGGGFGDGPEELRCAARQPEQAAWKRRDPQIPKSRWWNTDAPHVGFRLVRDAEALTLDEIRAWWNEVLGSLDRGT